MTRKSLPRLPITNTINNFKPLLQATGPLLHDILLQATWQSLLGHSPCLQDNKMDCYNYEIDNEIPSLGQIAEAALSIQDGTASQNPATASHFQVDIHAGIVLSRPVSSDTSQAAHDGIALPGRAGRHPFLATPYGGTAHYSHGLPADNVHGMEGGVEFFGDPRYSNPQQLVSS